MKLRYPGPKPFTSTEQDLFFGREEEVDKLNRLLYNNRITVLFGRSGYGKSSLIQAGVITHFSTPAINYMIVQVRFTSTLSPTDTNCLHDQLMNDLRKLIGTDELFLAELTPDGPPSLWQLFKTLQWKVRKQHSGILFIMDQFEEVFNFSQDYFDFARELAELVYNRMPENFQSSLMAKIEADESLPNIQKENSYLDTYKEEINFVEREIPTSFLIGIRSDRIFLLDELGELIPAIFNNRFSIGPLSIDNLDRIIRKPALANGQFDSPCFTYSDELVASIRKYLASSHNTSKKPNAIEGFEFQIICQYIESCIIKNLASEPKPMPEATMALVKEGYTNIIENYYINSISSLSGFDDFEKIITRFLIEKKLIDTKTDTRVCVDKTSILPLGFSDALLRKIIDTRLVRKELNTVSGESYEISHDTLIQAIRQASQGKILGDLHGKISSYYNKATKEYVRTNPFTSRYLIERKLIDKQGNLVRVRKEDLSQRPNLLKNMETLRKYRIVKLEGPPNNSYYILNEVFQDAAIDKVSLGQLSVIRQYSFGFFITLAILAMISLLTMRALRITARENALRLATLTEVSENPDRQQEVLLLFNELFDLIKDKDTAVELQAKKKLTRQFNIMFPYHVKLEDSLFLDPEFNITADESFILEVYNQSQGAWNGPRQVRVFDSAVNFKKDFNKDFNIVNYASLFEHSVFLIHNDYLSVYNIDSTPNHPQSFRGMRLNTRAIFKEIVGNRKRQENTNFKRPVTAANFHVSEIEPIRRLGNDILLTSCKLYCVPKSANPQVPDDGALESNKLLVSLNLKTGEITPLHSLSMDDLSSDQDNMAFPRYYLSSSGRVLGVLTKTGYKEHYFEYTSLQDPPPHRKKVRVPTKFFPLETTSSILITDTIVLSDFDYVSSRNSPSIDTGLRSSLKTGVHLKKTSLSGDVLDGRSFEVDIKYVIQDDSSIAMLSSQDIQILSPDLRPLYKSTLNKNSSDVRALLSPGNKAMLFRKDSVLTVIKGNSSDTTCSVDLKSNILSFAFSVTGDSIFCVTYDNINSAVDGNILHIFNSNLKELQTSYNYLSLGNTQIKSISISKKGNTLYLVNLRNKKSQYNNNEPDSICNWIRDYSNTKSLHDTLRTKYHFVGKNIFNQLSSLFHE